MPLLTVTLGAGATPFVPASNPQRAMSMRCWQGASPSYIGDANNVSSSTGIPVKAANATVDPTIFSPFTSGAINLNQWYGIGTNGDVIHVQYTPEE